MTRDEALWNLYKEQTEQGRHLEGQRVSVMNVIVSLATILSAVMGIDKNLNPADAPMAFAVGLLGTCGLALASAYHDRFEHHARRMRFFRDELSQLLFGSPIRFHVKVEAPSGSPIRFHVKVEAAAKRRLAGRAHCLPLVATYASLGQCETL